MKKASCLLLFVIYIQTSFSQITFEPGYFINLEGKKVTCLIKNTDWLENPSKIFYKLTPDSEIKEHSVDTIKEFEILGESNYLSSVVQIDISSDRTDRLSDKRNPEFEKKRLFLKLLVKGQINLYGYKKGDINRFFYKNAENNPEQLVYKKYVPDVHTIRTNEYYKQQILNLLKCNLISTKNIKTLKYNIESLQNLFQQYNVCVDSSLSYKEEKVRKTLFHISPKIGLNSTNASFSNSIVRRNFDFGNSTGIRIGLEAEFILPFNKNKWGVFIEPTFQDYTPENEEELNVIDYKSIELPIGIRHYFFLNKTSFFLNAGPILDIPLSSSINDNELSENFFSLLYGVGVLFDGKYAIELRRNTDRELLPDFLNASLIYENNFAVILSYKF